MSKGLLMFPEFARSARALLSVKPDNTTEHATNITAVEDSRYIFTSKPPENYYNLSLGRLYAIRQSGREIDMLEIRCNYLQQLSVMLQNEGIDKSQVQLGIISANITPVKIVASQLQGLAEAEMRGLLSNEGVAKSFLGDKLLAEHGLLNTISIKLQNPMASLLLTAQQINRMGFTIRSDSRPIMIFTPVVKSFFERDSKPLSVTEATAGEQMAIVSGKLTVKQSVHYAIDQYYDIGDLRISEIQRSRLIRSAYSENVEYEHICRFASTLQNSAGVPLKVQLATVQGMSMASLYDAGENSILLNSRLHPSQRTAELIERLADAIITTTSPSTAPLQVFEKHLLSIQLSAAWSIAPSKTVFSGLCSAFLMAQRDGGSFSLEAVTARVSRATQYITSGVSAVVQQDMQQEQKQGRERPIRVQPSIEEGPVANFLEGI